MASSSAMTTRAGRRRRRAVTASSVAVTRGVICVPVTAARARPRSSSWRSLELGHRLEQRVAGPRHGVGVARRLVVLLRRQRRLRHQGPHAGLVGRLLDDGQLLVEHGQLLPRPDEPGVDVSDPPFQQDAMHGASSVRGGEPATLRIEPSPGPASSGRFPTPGPSGTRTQPSTTGG